VSTWDRYVRDQYARITCSLKDTSCDSHSVYIQWWQDGYGKVRLNNTNGCNWTTFPSDTRYNGDGAFSTLKWRVCRDIQRGRDNCSSTVVHYTYWPRFVTAPCAREGALGNTKGLASGAVG